MALPPFSCMPDGHDRARLNPMADATPAGAAGVARGAAPPRTYPETPHELGIRRGGGGGQGHRALRAVVQQAAHRRAAGGGGHAARGAQGGPRTGAFAGRGAAAGPQPGRPRTQGGRTAPPQRGVAPAQRRWTNCSRTSANWPSRPTPTCATNSWPSTPGFRRSSGPGWPGCWSVTPRTRCSAIPCCPDRGREHAIRRRHRSLPIFLQATRMFMGGSRLRST